MNNDNIREGFRLIIALIAVSGAVIIAIKIPEQANNSMLVLSAAVGGYFGLSQSQQSQDAKGASTTKPLVTGSLEQKEDGSGM